MKEDVVELLRKARAYVAAATVEAPFNIRPSAKALLAQIDSVLVESVGGTEAR